MADDDHLADHDYAFALRWVSEQKDAGAEPEELLGKLGFQLREDVDIPRRELWKLVFRAALQVGLQVNPPRPKLENINTLDDVRQLLNTCSNIVVLTGAGISVSCGIPDFRSENGIYAGLKDRYDMPRPQCMFEINYFKKNPVPFFDFAKELFPGQFEPSPTHKFIKLLEDKGKLLRNYTQNIDTLEQVAGISRVLQCHGSFATATCIETSLGSGCGAKFDGGVVREDVFAGRVPRCPKCETGVIKPDIVFFNEQVEPKLHDLIREDKSVADLHIVIGSSLQVQPVASVVTYLPTSVPAILINCEMVGAPHRFDVELLGYCDTVIQYLCRSLGWDLPAQKCGASRDPDNRVGADVDSSNRATVPEDSAVSNTSRGIQQSGNSSGDEAATDVHMDDARTAGNSDETCSKPEVAAPNGSRSLSRSDSEHPLAADNITLEDHFVFYPPCTYVFDGGRILLDPDSPPSTRPEGTARKAVEANRSFLAELPGEILLYVAGYLSNHDLLYSFGLVCKLFHSLSVDPSVWASIVVTPCCVAELAFYADKTATALPLLFQLTSLETVDGPQFGNLEWPVEHNLQLRRVPCLAASLGCVSAVEHLTLTEQDLLSNDNVDEFDCLAEEGTAVTALELCGPLPSPLASAFPKLTRLALHSEVSMDWSTWGDFLASHSGLTSLALPSHFGSNVDKNTAVATAGLLGLTSFTVVASSDRPSGPIPSEYVAATARSSSPTLRSLSLPSSELLCVLDCALEVAGPKLRVSCLPEFVVSITDRRAFAAASAAVSAGSQEAMSFLSSVWNESCCRLEAVGGSYFTDDVVERASAGAVASLRGITATLSSDVKLRETFRKLGKHATHLRRVELSITLPPDLSEVDVTPAFNFVEKLVVAAPGAVAVVSAAARLGNAREVQFASGAVDELSAFFERVEPGTRLNSLRLLGKGWCVITLSPLLEWAARGGSVDFLSAPDCAVDLSLVQTCQAARNTQPAGSGALSSS